MRELARSASIRQFRRRGGTGGEAGIGLLGIALWMVVLLAIGLGVVAWIQKPHRPTSVVVVVLDTVRADHCSANGYPRPTTPHLAALAAEGLRFEQARTVAPWTLPSHASLFTGLLPSSHGCDWEHRWLLDRFETMAERMAASGRETFGVTTNANASSLHHLEQGFETFVESWTRRPAHRGLDDSGIANAEIDGWLGARDSRKPFFLFVNYADAHLPYAPPPPFDRQFGEASDRARTLAANPDLLQATLLGKERVSEGDAAGLAALYDGDVRQADQRLGELLEMLARHDEAEDTLVIVTSDHGELLGEAGAVDHQLSLAEALLRVPLVVRYPGRVKPAVIPEPVALTDLKTWIDEIADERLPDWSPSPDRLPAAFVAEQALPLGVLEALADAGGDPAPLSVRLAAAWRPDPNGGSKLLRRGSIEQLFAVGRDGSETLLSAPAAGALESLRQSLDDLRAEARFEEEAADLVGGTPTDPKALAEARRLGYAAATLSESLGMHASEHWRAAQRAVKAGDWERAFHEFDFATQLAPQQPYLALERARAADQANHSDAAGSIERFLQLVGSGLPMPATDVAWAKQRLETLRAGRGG